MVSLSNQCFRISLDVRLEHAGRSKRYAISYKFVKINMLYVLFYNYYYLNFFFVIYLKNSLRNDYLTSFPDKVLFIVLNVIDHIDKAEYCLTNCTD